MIPYFQVTEFSLGFFSLKAWGTLVALGFIIGIAVAYQEAKKKHFHQEILDLSFWIVFSSFVSARLFYVIGNISFYLESPWEIFKIWQGGLTIYGGFIGVLIAFLIFIKKKKVSAWDLAEPLMFALPLGIFFGRIGCFLIHDHVGKITQAPWGMKYLDGTIRHETAMYDGISVLALFILFLFLKRFSWSRKKRFFTAIFMLWYGLGRLVIDFYRATDLPTADVRWFGITVSQYASILLFIGGIYFFKKYLLVNPKKS